MKRNSKGPGGSLGSDLHRLSVSSQKVVARRGVQFAMGVMTPVEVMRMVTEKQIAFAFAATRAGQAAMLGSRPDVVISTALEPILLTAEANASRLANTRPANKPARRRKVGVIPFVSGRLRKDLGWPARGGIGQSCGTGARNSTSPSTMRPVFMNPSRS